jgi:hypothetical protein
VSAGPPQPSWSPPVIGSVPHYQAGQWSSWHWIDSHWLPPDQIRGNGYCPVAGYHQEPLAHLGIEYGLEICLYGRAGGVTDVPPFLIESWVCEGARAEYVSAGFLHDALDLLGRWATAVTASILSDVHRDLSDIRPGTSGLVPTILASAGANENAIARDVARIRAERAEAARKHTERLARLRAERPRQQIPAGPPPQPPAPWGDS